MSILDETSVGKIEVVGLLGTVNVRLDRKLIDKDSGETLSVKYSRYVLHPSSDISSQPEQVKQICQAAWTQDVVDNYNAFIESLDS